MACNQPGFLASSGESVGDWYVSNSGPYISPCTRRRQCRIAEPPFYCRRQFFFSPVCLSQTERRQMLKIAVDRFERTPSLTALVD